MNFKGKFLLYRETDKMKQTFDSIFKKYDGFLALSPPNTPISFKIRIYIIKAIVNMIGVHKPYLCINIGDKIYENVNCFKQNTNDKEFLIAK